MISTPAQIVEEFEAPPSFSERLKGLTQSEKTIGIVMRVLQEAFSQILGEQSAKEKGWIAEVSDINTITDWVCAKLQSLLGEKIVIIEGEEVVALAIPNCAKIIALTREILASLKIAIDNVTPDGGK